MSSVGQSILIIEDEEPIRRFLRSILTAAGYRILEAESGSKALRIAGGDPPEVIILDLGLPDMNGLEVLVELRKWLIAPIIILSAQGREQDKVAALEAGADDYLTKPFGVGELLARIKAALRRANQRSGGSVEPVFHVGELEIDPINRRVLLRDTAIHLTPIEFKLLGLMVKHAGNVLTHRFLLEQVWGIDRIDEVQYLRVFMAGLRRKLEPDPAQPRYLLTETGVGYRLAAE